MRDHHQMAVRELVAVIDTSVLMRAAMTEFFVRLHVAGACRLRWSREIWDEWGQTIHRRGDRLAERIRQAVAGVEDAQLHTSGLERDPSGFVFDPNDAHVAAAAIAARRMVDRDPERWGDARVLLVTCNAKDFRHQALAGEGIEVLEPDDFGCAVFESNTKAALRSVDERRADGLLLRMRGDGMTRTADLIEQTLTDLGL